MKEKRLQPWLRGADAPVEEESKSPKTLESAPKKSAKPKKPVERTLTKAVSQEAYVGRDGEKEAQSPMEMKAKKTSR